MKLEEGAELLNLSRSSCSFFCSLAALAIALLDWSMFDYSIDADAF